MRHSETQGTRLLGYIEATRDEALLAGDKKIRASVSLVENSVGVEVTTALVCNLVKVNTDGPSLEITANISVVEASAKKSYNADVFENQSKIRQF